MPVPESYPAKVTKTDFVAVSVDLNAKETPAGAQSKANAAQAAATTAAATDATAKVAAEATRAIAAEASKADSAAVATALATKLETAAATATYAPIAHTQPSSTITDFTEAVQDAVAALLGAGSNITLNYNDAGNTLTVTGIGDGTGLDAEAVRDAIGVALVGVGNIAVTVNDALDTITISTTATANSTDAQLRDRSTHTGTQAVGTITGLGTAATVNTGIASGDIPLLSTGGRLPIARVASGTPTGSLFVRDDGVLAAPVGGSGGASFSRVSTGTGRYHSLNGTKTSRGPGVNALRSHPIVFNKTATMTALVLRVTTAQAESVVRMGIYADDGGGLPGALVLDAGTVDTTTTGIKELAISQSLAAGVYWLATVQQGGAGSVASFGLTDGSPNNLQITGTSPNNIADFAYTGYSGPTTSGALPSSWGAASENNIVPNVLWKVA